MRTVVVYPLPIENHEVWDTFKPFMKRFVDTWKQFGGEIEMTSVCCRNPVPLVANQFVPAIGSFLYFGNGCDIGAAQALSKTLEGDAFMICMTSRCYLHRAGGLERMIAAREKHGPGLYGCSASHEGGRLHLCTRAYGIDAADFAAYPHIINSRLDGKKFEVGLNNPDGNLLEWMERRGRTARLVTFEGVHEKPDWFKIPNRFRNGDQSAMLVHDKHTDAYRDAPPEEKAVLAKWAGGV